MKMNKEEAIEYLESKEKIKGKTTYSAKEQKEIKKVMSEGKIYGDPVFEEISE